MKEHNYQYNFEKLLPYYNETEAFKLENFIPDYFKEKLYLPTKELNFEEATKNIDDKLARDWKFHLTFKKIAHIVAELGTCSRRKVGAVLVRNRRMLATGFNGTPPGSPHCNEEICPGKNSISGSDLSLCAAVHAEENCLIYCAKYGVSASDSVLYCTAEPCDDCMKLIETVGIRQVIYSEAYPTKMSALRKYFKVKSLLIDDLAKQYSDFCQGRVKFLTSD